MSQRFFRRAISGFSTRQNANSGDPADLVDHENHSNDPKGPLGLNVLHSTANPVIDIIFVHGLGGGSRKTWSKSADPHHYWPKEWLPRDPDFTQSRILSFGYKADWGERRESVLNIQDFAQTLLSELKDDPGIRKNRTRLVLVGHSMGGIVIKKAYILARQDPTYKDLAARFHTVFFLATPHRGSDLAPVLSNIIKITSGAKPYVAELEPKSISIATINDTFRHYAQDLQLFSFYETEPVNLRFFNALIVEKGSATLGYAHERIALLNADHRGVCKFDRQSDPNYRSLRNALAATISTITEEVARARDDELHHQQRIAASLFGLGFLHAPSDDLVDLRDNRVAGTCGWLTSMPKFLKWQCSDSSNETIFWLHGRPGTGKSILSMHVIEELQSQKSKCSYFFFKEGTAYKGSIGYCLRSLAYQMLSQEPDPFSKLSTLHMNAAHLERDDDSTFWRRVFKTFIFQSGPVNMHYWVIDALDECSNARSFLKLLIETPEWLRIFVTSRKSFQTEQGFLDLGNNVCHHEIESSDTIEDIQLCVKAGIDRIPAEVLQEPASITQQIIEKSSGLFLWVHWVLRELEHAWSMEAVEEILNDVSSDMNRVYSKSLECISVKEQKLAKPILTWAVCALRPLMLSEMQCVIKIETGQTIGNLERMITAACGQLVFVDQNCRVQMLHQTAKEFLRSENLQSPFAIRGKEPHIRLATICLNYLQEKCIGNRPAFRQNVATVNRTETEVALIEYASLHFSDHLFRCLSVDRALTDALCAFLQKSVLSWIEAIARMGDLTHVTRTAANIKAYLKRCLGSGPTMPAQCEFIEDWVTDIVRVTLRFRLKLLELPSSIHWLIPPLCPTDSIISKTHASSARGLTIKGLRATTYDDLLTRIDYRGARATSLNHGERYFAVGLSTGTILVYHALSAQVKQLLQHEESVKCLRFSPEDELLASSGCRTVRIWRLQTGDQTHSFELGRQPIALSFRGSGQSVAVATQGDEVVTRTLSQGDEVGRLSWEHKLDEGNPKRPWRQPPTHAVFSHDRTLLAVGYRGHPVCLIDVERDMFYGKYCRQGVNGEEISRPEYILDAIAFNPNSDNAFLFVSYGDGELAVYDLWTTELKHRLRDAYAHEMCCSPDGRTLVTGSCRGGISLYNISSTENGPLVLIHYIESNQSGLKSMTFSSDGLRFIDIAHSRCRIWESTVLVRKNARDSGEDPGRICQPVVSKRVKSVTEYDEPEITSLVCHPDAQTIFCGKQDGGLYAYRASDAQELQLLFNHENDMRIKFLVWGTEHSLLISAGDGGRLLVQKLQRFQSSWSIARSIADTTLNKPIYGLLIDESNDRLLIICRKASELRTIDGKLLVSIEAEDGAWHRAIGHPLNKEQFILFMPSVARIYKWTDGTEVTGPNGVALIRLDGSSSENSWSQMFSHSSGLLLEFSKPVGYNSSPCLSVWSSSDISEPTSASQPGFNILAPVLKYIVGISGDRLVFVDVDLWVCSLDLISFATKPTIKRHFFIPSEWLNSFGDITMQLTSKNEVVFAKRHELLVFKRAFEFEETVHVSQNTWASNGHTALQ